MSSDANTPSSPYEEPGFYSLKGLNGRDLVNKCIYLVAKANKEMDGPNEKRCLAWLRQEEPRFSEAADWCVSDANTNAALGLALGAVLWKFWYRQGHTKEALNRLEALLFKAGSVDREGALVQSAAGWVTYGAGILAVRMSQLNVAEAYLRQSRQRGEKLKDKSLVAESLMGMGELAFKQNKFPDALACLTESLKLFEEVQNKAGQATCLKAIAIVKVKQAKGDEAISHLQHGLSIARDLQSSNMIEAFLNDFGVFEDEVKGNYREADSYYTQSLEIIRQLQDRGAEARILNNRSSLAYKWEVWKSAKQYAAKSASIYRNIGEPQNEAYALINESAAEIKLGDFPSAYERLLKSIELLTPTPETPDRLGIVYALEEVANLLIGSATSDEDAVRLFGAAARIRKEINTPITGSYARDYELKLQDLSDRMGKDAYQAAWKRGEAMSLSDAIAFAHACY